MDYNRWFRFFLPKEMFHHHSLPSSWIFFSILFGTIYFLLIFLLISINFSDEIAHCMEKSYKQISLKEAARILYVTEPGALDAIARKVKETMFNSIGIVLF